MGPAQQPDKPRAVARVYQTWSMGEAKVRAALVGEPGQADLCVHRVHSWGEARGDAIWYLTRDKQEADTWIYFGSIGMSQIKVCFVDDYSQAGWQRRHPLRGAFR